MMELRLISASETRTFPLQGSLVLVGAAPDADIHLDEAGMAEVALRMEKSAQGFRVTNVENDSRIRLNGARFQQAELGLGDRLEIGSQIGVLDHGQGKNVSVPSKNVEAGLTQDNRLREILEAFAALVSSETDLQKVAEGAVETMAKAFRATEAFLFALDREGNPTVSAATGPASAQERFSDTLVQDVLQSGKGRAIPHALTDPQYGSAQSIVELKLQTVLAAPIRLAGRVVGLIYLGCRKGDVSYSETDLAVLETYSVVLGMLLHSVDYISQQREAIRRLAGADTEDGIVTQSPVMQNLLEQLRNVAPSEITVLIQGETGTGKEVLSEYLHRKSDRAKKSFVAVNCSSLRGELLESELFGYKKGAFTGAQSDRRGLFQAAHQGTLLLDEIGEMDLNLQAKLLRVLESGRVRPVGAVQEEEVDVRVVAATHRDLQKMVSEGVFRQDLYFRIAQVTLVIPPLRERAEDILLLSHHFLEKFRAKYPHKDVRDFHPDAWGALMAHEWPGNVRELANVVHRAVLSASSALVTLEAGAFSPRFAEMEEATSRFQKSYLERALVLSKNNKEDAARLLGMSRSTFFRYLSQLGIQTGAQS